MTINNEILKAVIHCKHKAYFKREQLDPLPKTDFEIVFDELKQKQKTIIETKFSVNSQYKNINHSPDLRLEKNKTYLQISFNNSEVDLALDGICNDDKNNYTPILISPFEKVQKSDRLLIALQSYYIKQHFNLKIEEAKIIFGEQQKGTKIILNKFSKEVKKIVEIVEQIKKTEQPPAFHKNAHCYFCEFNLICDEKLKERDDLSLLSSLKPKDIEQRNNRGIFSVKQLSYTFRPKKNPYRRRKFLPELKTS